MKRSEPAKTEARRILILESALSCFLNIGFEKTSMDDVAKRAGLTRPLLYLLFRNKGDLLRGVFDLLIEGRAPAAEKILRGKGPRGELLMKAVSVLILEPWERISGHPRSAEFFASCGAHNQTSYQRYETLQRKVFEGFFGDKTVAQVFCMAMEGAMSDTPSLKTLHKRVLILVEKFTKE